MNKISLTSLLLFLSLSVGSVQAYTHYFTNKTPWTIILKVRYFGGKAGIFCSHVGGNNDNPKDGVYIASGKTWSDNVGLCCIDDIRGIAAVYYEKQKEKWIKGGSTVKEVREDKAFSYNVPTFRSCADYTFIIEGGEIDEATDEIKPIHVRQE